MWMGYLTSSALRLNAQQVAAHGQRHFVERGETEGLDGD